MAKATLWSITDAECAKARGANRIRYPGSPSCKRWALGSGSYDALAAVANVLSAPPGEYARKGEAQRN